MHCKWRRRLLRGRQRAHQSESGGEKRLESHIALLPFPRIYHAGMTMGWCAHFNPKTGDGGTSP
jgi:hypothetical protein